VLAHMWRCRSHVCLPGSLAMLHKNQNRKELTMLASCPYLSCVPNDVLHSSFTIFDQVDHRDTVWGFWMIRGMSSSASRLDAAFERDKQLSTEE